MKIKFTFPSDPCKLAEVRRRVRAFLEKCDFHECGAELLVLGLDEACTNIIRHAYCHNGKPVRLEMERLRDRVRFRSQGLRTLLRSEAHSQPGSQRRASGRRRSAHHSPGLRPREV